MDVRAFVAGFYISCDGGSPDIPSPLRPRPFFSSRAEGPPPSISPSPSYLSLIHISEPTRPEPI
eukprot:3209800-Pyramimonas_sp.AAC.1